MPRLDRYLLSEFAQATFGTLVILLMVALGGVFADVLGDIARGRVPAGMMLAQLGLVLLNWLPLILPLGLMLGLMLSVGRLYRDAEMPVLASVGVGPRRILRPLLMLVLPVVAVIGACSLWLGPWAERTSRQMVHEANRNLLISGLEPGSFTELPGGGVVYVGSMSEDGTRFQRVFIYRQNDERMDVTTSRNGVLRVDGNGQRFITLYDGFEVEGPRAPDRLDWRLMRYAANEAQMPANEVRYDPDDPEMLDTPQLLADRRAPAQAELHRRIAPPLLALAFALMAVPLARSSPREGRYGRVLMGFLAYLFGMNLMQMGADWVAKGRVGPDVGLWWLTAPLLLVAVVLYLRDGRIRGPRGRAAAAAGAGR